MGLALVQHSMGLFVLGDSHPGSLHEACAELVQTLVTPALTLLAPSQAELQWLPTDSISGNPKAYKQRSCPARDPGGSQEQTATTPMISLLFTFPVLSTLIFVQSNPKALITGLGLGVSSGRVALQPAVTDTFLSPLDDGCP